MSALLEARGIRKVYVSGDGQPLEVLRGVDVEAHRGEFVASDLDALVSATIHPSAILRAQDDQERSSAMDGFVQDLSTVAQAVAGDPS